MVLLYRPYITHNYYAFCICTQFFINIISKYDLYMLLTSIFYFNRSSSDKIACPSTPATYIKISRHLKPKLVSFLS